MPGTDQVRGRRITLRDDTIAYATAKAAVEGLTRALAVDYGPRGIRVNAVALGSIDTERYQAFLAGQDPAEAGRGAQPLRPLALNRHLEIIQARLGAALCRRTSRAPQTVRRRNPRERVQ